LEERIPRRTVAVRGHAAIAVLLGFTAAAVAQPQAGFWFPGLAPNTTSGTVLALSQDGTVAAGANGGFNGTFGIQPGYTWTRQNGRYDYGLEPGMPIRSPAYAVSSDGSVLAGQYDNLPQGQFRAFRRVGGSPIEDLGLLPGELRANARGVSGDGSIVVGYAEHNTMSNPLGQAFRWTEQTGMQGLGYARPNGTYAEARGISRDGSTIVGVSQSGGAVGPVDAFMWTASGGMHALPGLPGAPYIDNNANAVNADGSVVVGWSTSATTAVHAARWTSAGVQDLGVVAPSTTSIAYAVSDDGNVIGGILNGIGPFDLAFVWTPDSGMSLLSDYLGAHGVVVPAGYRIEDVYAISGDGMTFGGVARNLSTNVREGFVATVPAPCSLLILLAPTLRRRRRSAA
jgi:probable HAF family extracellular repeat protein